MKLIDSLEKILDINYFKLIKNIKSKKHDKKIIDDNQEDIYKRIKRESGLVPTKKEKLEEFKKRVFETIHYKFRS